MRNPCPTSAALAGALALGFLAISAFGEAPSATADVDVYHSDDSGVTGAGQPVMLESGGIYALDLYLAANDAAVSGSATM